METINHNSLWIVLKDMPVRTVKVGISEEDQDQVKIKKGDIIEFRYHYGVHFRTVDNDYYFVEQKVLFKHCALYGRVLKEVSWKYEKTLDEILREGLYITE